MSYRGDIRLGDTIDLKFTTRAFTTGAPFTLAGSPVISAYVDNGTTEITAGITLSVDFDSRTGLNNVRVVATSGNGYATGTNIDLVITTGTVNGVSVVGEVIGSFSIEKRSALMPTTAGLTLDVSAGGEAGLDWANVGSPTTVLNLSGTTVKNATDIKTATDDIQARIPAALTAGGKIKASMDEILAVGQSATDLKDFADTGYDPATHKVADVAVVDALTANNDKTGYALGANGLDSTALTAAAKNAIADSHLDRNMATGTDSGTDSTAVRTPRQALRALRNKQAVAAGVLTVNKEDDVTASWTAAVTTTAGNPISTVDPT
jgi:hypothetical protein